MEFFKEAKAIRLRSHLNKYLAADDDQVSTRQSRRGDARRARWLVELVDGNSHVVRLKSCFNRYLTASSHHFLLGMTGHKVLQTSPENPEKDLTIEWQPIRVGFQVKLRTFRGTCLRANGGTPPWRNSVTHDNPHAAATRDWVMWDVEAVEVWSMVSNFPSVSDEITGQELGFELPVSVRSKLSDSASPSPRFSMEKVDVEVERSDAELKHLEFLKSFAVHGVVVASNLYDNAKQNSGPLKSTVETVENAVTAVVDPVYQTVKGVPGDLLVFLDTKVDEVAHKFDESAPPAAKKAVSKAQTVVKKVSLIAQDLAEETKVAGPFAAISHAGVISKQIAVNQLALVWFKANQYPALHGASEVAVLAAVHWSEKHNNLVKEMATQGYSLFNYIPLVPVEEMAKAYKQVEEAAGKKTDAGSSSRQ